MQNFDFSPLLKYAESENIPFKEDALERLSVYGNLLIEWNEKINLTAITEPREIVIKHFCDCMSVLKHADLKKDDKLIDIGSGAGFPGMVLKILRPEAKIFLLDGHAKRFIFLEDLQKNIGLYTNNIHERAELAAKKADFREGFDFVTARAVARLSVLSELCLPFLKVGGTFVSMKGPEPEDEILEAKKGILTLGGAEPNIFKELLPDDSLHSIITVKKISQTPTKYPRAFGKITKLPL